MDAAVALVVYEADAWQQSDGIAIFRAAGKPVWYWPKGAPVPASITAGVAALTLAQAPAHR